jgi:hypothetical protein
MIRWAAMQSVVARTNHVPAEGSENTSVKSIAEIEGAIRDPARLDVAPPNSKDSWDTAANVNSLVRRGTSLSELQSVIGELRQLHEFLDSEGERLEREISEYVQFSKSTISSVLPMARHVVHWKKARANKSLSNLGPSADAATGTDRSKLGLGTYRCRPAASTFTGSACNISIRFCSVSTGRAATCARSR